MHGVLGGIVDDGNYQSVVDENSSSKPAFELGDRSVSTEMDDAGRDRRSHVSVQAYGFREAFVDLGDLIRCQALVITHNGRVPTFVTCKDAVTALCRLPGTISARIRELSVPDQLMAADDCDNRDYVKALGRDLVEATSDVEVITLSVPDDLVAGGSDNECQYEFWLWGLHEAVLHAFRRGQYLGLRFAHRKQFSATSDRMDVYQTHNVDQYIKPMLFGKSVCDRLRAAELQLIRSQRYPTPPSIIDDSDTLFAILHAIDYGAWLMAGYTIMFTQPHAWEKGSVLLLQRNPQTVDTLSENCKTAASWWLERCASCIGNGFAGSDVLYAMETCRRGGRENRQWNLGKQIFQKGIKAQHGCVNCAFPGTACRRRQQQDECRAPPLGYCQFGEVIYDVVVGLCQSECYFYREHLSLAMQWATDDDPKDEDIAKWLGGPLSGVGKLASQIVPIFLMWTRAAREQLCKRSM